MVDILYQQATGEKKSDSGFGAFHVDNGLVERCPKFAVKITKIVREKSITVVKPQAGEDEIIKDFKNVNSSSSI